MAKRHTYYLNDSFRNPVSQKTLSLGIYEIGRTRFERRSLVLVRVRGPRHLAQEIQKRADQVVEQLDNGIYDGPKTITLK